MRNKFKTFLNADLRGSNADLRRFPPKPLADPPQFVADNPRPSACNPRESASKFVFIALFLFIFVAHGCAPVLIGGAAVAGAIVVAQDFATTSVDMSFKRVWNVANSELKKIGTVEKSFQRLGEIRATVEGSKIKVTVSRLTERTVDIKVTARKNLLPNTELAQAILASIIRNL